MAQTSRELPRLRGSIPLQSYCILKDRRLPTTSAMGRSPVGDSRGGDCQPGFCPSFTFSIGRRDPLRKEIPAIDLDIKVSVRTVAGSKVLGYALSSPSGAASVTHVEIQTVPFRESFDVYRIGWPSEWSGSRIVCSLTDPTGEAAVEPLMSLDMLCRQLSSAGMKQLYRQGRKNVQTI